MGERARESIERRGFRGLRPCNDGKDDPAADWAGHGAGAPFCIFRFFFYTYLSFTLFPWRFLPIWVLDVLYIFQSVYVFILAVRTITHTSSLLVSSVSLRRLFCTAVNFVLVLFIVFVSINAPAPMPAGSEVRRYKESSRSKPAKFTFASGYRIGTQRDDYALFLSLLSLNNTNQALCIVY